jgi:hypothetical protein
MSRFTRSTDFHALSVRDLADARDAYHVHLANLENVVGTALGRYLIRRTDPDFTDPNAKKRSWSTDPRTLANSGVTPWSWPCVLVFVREWMTEAPTGADADQVVPRRLYLADGRQVPTCVVHTPLAIGNALRPQVAFGPGLRGAGQPLFAHDQGRARMGTVGALVTDGPTVYALTSSHVVGAAGTAVEMLGRDGFTEIGRVASNAAVRRPLQSLYPGVAGTRAELSVDAALVELGSIEQWTTQVFGLGTLGNLLDLNVDTLALSLIGCPVRAFGAATGPMRGAVLGLFHRWRSVGGVDEIAELLIGPRNEHAPVLSRPGDSGALWVWDEAAEAEAEGGVVQREFLLEPKPPIPVVRPLAMQWGGQVILSAAGAQPVDYVLASTVAGIAQSLSVTLLNDDSMSDHSLYWGKVGHYKIAEAACHLGTAGGKLAALLEANLVNIAVTDDDIVNGHLPAGGAKDVDGDGVADEPFIALADVPDLVWRRKRPKDAPSHFADMDEPGSNAVGGKTLMQLWEAGGNGRTSEGWTAFYGSLKPPPKDQHRGALPFRVAQLYQIMVDAVRAHDLVEYVSAAGVLAHYVGDACQPLHVSRLHHGLPDDPSDDHVHDAYESDMLDKDANRVLVVAGVNDTLSGFHAGDPDRPSLVSGAAQAAAAVVDLMARTIEAIKPSDLLEVFDNPPAGQSKTTALWNAFGDATIARLADGARTLAVLWQSAWDEGDGDDIAVSHMTTQSQAALQLRYNDKTFAPNAWLKDQHVSLAEMADA